MNLKRLSTLLLSLGVAFMFVGLCTWGARTPQSAWLNKRYYQCLWSTSYDATSDIMPDARALNPHWHANKASCATADQDSLLNFAEDAKRNIARITTGVDPGPAAHPQPSFILTPPFFNGAGLLLLFFGCIVAITRSDQTIETQTERRVGKGSSTLSGQLGSARYDSKKWNTLIQYDPDLTRIADALAPYGQKYLDQFAEAFLAINDKNYLPQIVQTILETAKMDAAASTASKGKT
jgi:hypothetical protein